MLTPDIHTDQTPQGAPPHGRAAGTGHEVSDISVRGIILFGAGLVGLAVVVHFALGMFMSAFERAEKRAEALTPPMFRDETGQFPGPRLQIVPREDLDIYRNQQNNMARSYGWVDRDKGKARIPVDRAISILAETGLPKGKDTPPRGSRTRDQK